MRGSLVRRHARLSDLESRRKCGTSVARESILFARNLFLPDDLGGNRYPYETIRRLGERGHPVTVFTPRLHPRFPHLAGFIYRLYAIARPHPAVIHFTTLAI